jgi:hypothetical protein
VRIGSTKALRFLLLDDTRPFSCPSSSVSDLLVSAENVLPTGDPGVAFAADESGIGSLGTAGASIADLRFCELNLDLGTFHSLISGLIGDEGIVVDSDGVSIFVSSFGVSIVDFGISASGSEVCKGTASADSWASTRVSKVFAARSPNAESSASPETASLTRFT